MKKVTKHYQITKEDILAGKYDSQALIEPLWWSVSIYDGKAQYEADLKPFTPEQRAVFAIQWYEAEVCNGGHDQFLCNSTGIVWQDALEGFERIGAEKCAAILRNVIAKCGGSIPFDREEREEMLEKLYETPDDSEPDDIFDDDDSAFYAFNSALEQQITAYAKAHPEAFVFEGDVEVPEILAK